MSSDDGKDSLLLWLYHQRFGDSRIARELELVTGQPTTRRMVYYWRLTHDLPAWPGPYYLGRSLSAPHEIERLTARRVKRWHTKLTEARHLYAARLGWGHLLPGVEAEAPTGFDLTRRQADLLTALRDHGPQTRADLAKRLGWRKLAGTHLGTLDRLVSWGLVCRAGCKRVGVRLASLYTLTDRAIREDGLLATCTKKDFLKI